MSAKSIARRLLGPLPQWAPVGIAPPQQSISVLFEHPGRSIDVTHNNSVASLKPLTVAVGTREGIGDPGTARLVFRDDSTGREIGCLKLRRSMRNTRHPIRLFEVERADHCCLAWPRKHWNAWLQSRAMRRNKNPHNFQMAPTAVQQLMTFYICPRPVVLVSVSEAAHSNIFPMDLIGPLGGGCFALALRSTSVSVPTMRVARRLALSGIGAEHKDAVYRLGEHHKKPFAEWNALPFPTIPTAAFGIPAVEPALWIRELAVEASEEIGSHTFFICRIVSERTRAEGLQLHHTAGFYQEFRRRRGMAFPAA